MKRGDLLKPYAIHVAGIHSAIDALSDDELTKLGIRFGKARAAERRIAGSAFEAGQAAGRNLRINPGVGMAGGRRLDREAT